MTQAGQHPATARVQNRSARTSRTKMNASLAMVVCFVGFQGVVPQSWDPAAASTGSGPVVLDGIRPTGIVGSSLLLPLGGSDALDPLDRRSVGADADADAGTATAGATGGESAATATGISARPSAGSLFAPLEGLSPSSSFGFRTSPITGESGEFHTGQDYSAPCGTPVYAADAGTVRAVGWHQWGGGNRVEVDHGNGLITTYNHLRAISVREGDTVKGGEAIAEVGTTGSSTGCHLHFETILDGEHVDPLRWKLVAAQHTARKGELQDYSPGGDGAADIPVWAQSSTRSDQHDHTADVLPMAPASSGDAGAAFVVGTTLPLTPETSTPPHRDGSPVPHAPVTPDTTTPGRTPDTTTPDRTPDATTPDRTPDTTTPGGTTTPGTTPPESGTTPGTTPPAGNLPVTTAPTAPDPGAPTAPIETAPTAPDPGAPTAPVTTAPTAPAPGATPPAGTDPGATPPAGTAPVTTPPVTTPPGEATPEPSCDTDPTTPDSEESAPGAQPAPGTESAPGPGSEPDVDPAQGTVPAPVTGPAPGPAPAPGAEPAPGADPGDPSCDEPGTPDQGTDPAPAPAPGTGQEGPGTPAPAPPVVAAVPPNDEQG